MITEVCEIESFRFYELDLLIQLKDIQCLLLEVQY
jgi:hypothetical protein